MWMKIGLHEVLFSYQRKQLMPLSIDLSDQSQDCSLHQINCPLRDIGAGGLRAGQADEGWAAYGQQQRPHRLYPLPEQHLHRTTIVIAIEAI